jgi:poly(A) polymerase Pap1
MELFNSNSFYLIEDFFKILNPQTFHVDRTLFLLCIKPIHDINLLLSKWQRKVWDEEKHNEMRSEEWVNYAKYHRNPTAYVSIKV